MHCTDREQIILIDKERGVKMKKKILAITLSLCTAFSMVACSDGKDTGSTETTAAGTVKTEGKITLGEYKGIKVDASLKEVSEEDIQAYLDSVLESLATEEEVTEGVVFAADDIAKLDYTCTIDGKEYKTATGAKISISEDGFDVDGFTDSIIGKTAGDEYEITLKLADDFGDKEVAGKDATFKIKLTAKVNIIIPEFTDALVAENFEYLKLSTMDDMLEYLERDLRINQVYSDIWSNVIAKEANVESYDSEELASLTEKYAESQEYMLYYYYGYDLESYLEESGTTEEEFMASMEEAAKSELKMTMIVREIAAAENITVTEEVYNEVMLKFAKSYGYDTVEELVKAYEGQMTEEDFNAAVLQFLVEEFVCENVEFVEGYGLRSDDETSSEDASDESTEDSSESSSDDSTEETSEETTKAAE